MRRRSLVSAVIVLLAASPAAWIAGCGTGESDPWWSGLYDLSGIVASAELAGHVSESLAAHETPVITPHDDDLAAYEDLIVRLWAPATRQAAGDEIYARWQVEPRNVLWLELAKNYDFLLRRRDALEAMCAIPELGDPDTPLGAYVAGRLRFRHGDRGELYRRAETGVDELEPLARVWLQFKLSEVDNEAGDNLAGVRRLLAVLPQARVMGGARLEALAWDRTAGLLTLADRLDDALHAVAIAGVLFERAGAEYEMLRVRIRLAKILDARREHLVARRELLALAEEAGAKDFDWLGQRARDNAAGAAVDQGDYVFALDLDRAALAQARALDDPLNLPRTLASVAHDHRMLGALDSCRVYLMAAKDAVAAYPDGRNRMLLNGTLAEYYCLVGQYDLADSLLAAAAGMGDAAGTSNDEARMLLKLLPQALEMGRADLAYRWLDRLDDLTGSMHNRGLDENLRADHRIASLRLLTRQGEFVRAAAAQRAAEAAVATAGGEGKVWEVSAAAGELALARGDVVAAETSFTECLALAAGGTDPDLLIRSRRQLGQVLLAQGRSVEARELFRPVAEDTTFGRRFSSRLHNLLLTGESFLAEGRSVKAQASFRRVLTMAGRHTPADLVAAAELGLGRALALAGDAPEAMAALERARQALAQAPGRSSFDEIAAYLADDERRVREALAGLLLDHPDLPEGNPAEAALAVARPDLAGAPLPASGAPRLVFFVGEERSYGWIVTDVGVTCDRLPGRAGLRAMLAPVIADLATPGRPPAERPRAELAAALVGGLIRVWRQDRVLSVAPDDLLHGVPWCALPWPGGPEGTLILDHGPVVLTAGGPVSPTRVSVPGTRPILAVGRDGAGDAGAELPTLRNAESEARRVAALWPIEQQEIRVGEAAAWDDLVLSGLDRFGVVHVATHATVHQGLPGRSTLRLASGDGSEPVTVAAVADLDLDADLVYLSCCHAGRRLGRRGGGTVDFAGAFLDAGARSVVASTLWVDDEAAAALAGSFYRLWLSGAGRAEALRGAQQELRSARDEWRHPAYWAFTRLVGAAD
ncbi:MAG: CHAT domain-containing protein [bacterium]|nr:CHAT domain-containing protein [bacterium]